MSPPLLSALAGLFLSGIIAQLIYWHLVRPLLLKKLRYRLFAVRDDLRLALLRGEIGQNQPAYKIVEELCNMFICTMGHVGITSILWAKSDRAATLRVVRNTEIVQEASHQIREMFDSISKIAMGACLVNSPIWLPIIAVWLITSYWSQNSQNRIDRWKQGAIGLSYA